MRNDILEKLARLLRAPIERESEVVYLMVEIRKLIEQKDKELVKNKRVQYYPRISFYSDWCVHTELDRSAAQDQLRQIAVLTKIGEIDNKIFNFLRFEELKSELSEFFKEYGLDGLVFFEYWKVFERALIDVLSDCPLLVKEPGEGQIKKFSFDKIIGDGKYVSCNVEYEKAKDGSGYSASIGILE